MTKYSVSQVVPSIIKIRKIKNEFKKEYDEFMNDYSYEAFVEYNGYMRVLEKKYPFDDEGREFLEFLAAFWNQKEGWDFVRSIIKEFDYYEKLKCRNCIVQASCYNNMTYVYPEKFCEETDRIRDFKSGFLIFIFLKYFRTAKKNMIYD